MNTVPVNQPIGTLLIRNQPGGMIWQIYHVISLEEAAVLSTNARKNAFNERELIDYDETCTETFQDWRGVSKDYMSQALKGSLDMGSFIDNRSTRILQLKQSS